MILNLYTKEILKRSATIFEHLLQLMIKFAIRFKLELDTLMPSNDAPEDIINVMQLDTHDLALILTKEDCNTNFFTPMLIFC